MDIACLRRLEAFVTAIPDFDTLDKQLQVTFIAYALMLDCRKVPFTAMDIHEASDRLRLSMSDSVSIAQRVFADKQAFRISPPGYVLTRQGEQSVRDALEMIANAQREQDSDDETKPASSDAIIPLGLVKDTRKYVESTVHQINGSYEQGWYDACAVMMRRLIETLLIETLNRKGLEAKIKTADGDYVPLDRLIGIATSGLLELSRDTKRELGTVKSLGDKSAHSRRFFARRSDIDNIKLHFRAAVEELVAILRE